MCGDSVKHPAPLCTCILTRAVYIRIEERDERKKPKWKRKEENLRGGENGPKPSRYMHFGIPPVPEEESKSISRFLSTRSHAYSPLKRL